VTRGVLGLNGRIGDNWRWDGYYQYGRTVRDQIGSGYRTNWRYTFAVDAVDDGTGTPVCRVTRDGLAGARPDLARPDAAGSGRLCSCRCPIRPPGRRRLPR
jgi:hypothetical protein